MELRLDGPRMRLPSVTTTTSTSGLGLQHGCVVGRVCVRAGVCYARVCVVYVCVCVCAGVRA